MFVSSSFHLGFSGVPVAFAAAHSLTPTTDLAPTREPGNIDSYTLGGCMVAVGALMLGSYYAAKWVRTKKLSRPLLPLALITAAALHMVSLRHDKVGAMTETTFLSAKHYVGRMAEMVKLQPPRLSAALEGTPKSPALIAEAQAALERWKIDGSLSDLDGFIVRVGTEVRAKPLSKNESSSWLEDWDAYITKRQSLLGLLAISNLDQARESLESYRSKIHQDFPHYLKVQPSMVTLFKTKRGNCESRALIMCAAINAAQIELAPHLRYSVEVFSEHIQPVLFDHDSGASWDLWSGGKIRPKNKGDIYDAAIIYHAFLMRQGADSPVTEEELLIARAADPDKAPPGYVASAKPWRSVFGFPASDAYYPTPPEDSKVKTLEEIHTKEIAALRLVLENMDIDFGTAVLSFEKKATLIFRSQELQDEYEALKNEEQKKQFLISLTIKFWQHTLETESSQLLQNVFSNPFVLLPQMTADQLGKVTSALSEYNEFLKKTQVVYNALKNQFPEATLSFDRVPALKKLLSREKHFFDSLESDPGQFFLMLNQMQGLETKDRLFSLVTTRRQVIDQKVFDFMADPSLIGIAEQKADESAYRPPYLSEPQYYEIEVEFIAPKDEGSSHAVNRKLAEAIGSNELQPPSDPPISRRNVNKRVEGNRIKVSPQTMIDLVLLFPHQQNITASNPDIFLNRWSHSLASLYAHSHTRAHDRRFSAAVEYATGDGLTATDYSLWLLWREPHEISKLPPPIARTLNEIRKRHQDWYSTPLPSF